jgi:hypothetical protein
MEILFSKIPACVYKEVERIIAKLPGFGQNCATVRYQQDSRLMYN